MPRDRFQHGIAVLTGIFKSEPGQGLVTDDSGQPEWDAIAAHQIPIAARRAGEIADVSQIIPDLDPNCAHERISLWIAGEDGGVRPIRRTGRQFVLENRCPKELCPSRAASLSGGEPSATRSHR